jgi:hypothetical protein
VQLRAQKAYGRGKGSWKKHRINKRIVQQLMDIFYECNPYARKFQRAREILGNSPKATLALIGINRPGLDNKRYNKPTVKQVATVVAGLGAIVEPRQIILRQKPGKLKKISDLHLAYFPLRYPFFFPRGSQQWDGLYQAWTPQCKRKLCVR